MAKLKGLCLSLLGAGIIVLVIGVYFAMFGAGIPYQDPTTEMTIKWLTNNLAGTLCLQCGVLVFGIGLFGYFIARRMEQKK